MIFTVIENFVFFGATFALAAYVAASLLRVGIRKNLLEISPFALTRIFAGLILLPPVFALWLVLAALLPETWLGAEVFKAAHVAPVHEWHLLTDLTAPFEPFLAYATVLFVACVSFFIVWKSVRGYFRIGNIVRFLEIEASAPTPEKIALVENIAERRALKVGLVMSEQPLTFVWGFWQSKLVLSSGLLNTLNDAELKGVIEHEAAHHVRRDNLVKLFLSAASYLSPVFPLTRRILSWQSEQIELVCDEIAAAATKEPLEIASALVKMRRKFPAFEATLSLTSGFMSEETSSIEPRVKRLLQLADAPPLDEQGVKLAHKPFFEIASITALFLSSLAALMFLAPLIVHQTAETLIEFIK
ncbi:MAG TPA: M56 family metallopeptidase [Pyrinomonadaceae bacterium]|nr:M56 family metallopeptidase [Pyrinomonadaceae bacterium]